MGERKLEGLGLRIGYFAHDLSDPAVTRRVQMLQAGGADVVLLGFRRSSQPIGSIAGIAPVDLGRTRDARLVSRLFSVLWAVCRAPMWSRRLVGAQAIVARNLEMLLLASAARRLAALTATLTYEVLDVHRLMLGDGLVSRALRSIERGLMRRASMLVVSSSAFLTNYFDLHGGAPARRMIVENKPLVLNPTSSRADLRRRPPAPPWRIGWFGMIRCSRSLDILTATARQARGLVEVEIRGRPALTEFEDFEAQIRGAPGVKYDGPYDVSEVPALYAGVHFVWAIDYFEEGQNSSWLLPNRLYEGQLHGAVAIALRGVETGRWLARHDAGLLLEDPGRELGQALSSMTSQSYAVLAAKTAAVPLAALTCTRAECEDLVRAIVEPVKR